MADAPGLDPGGLVRLATWLSPAFPVGGFAFSHGLEAAVAEGRVFDEAEVRDWIALLLEQGSGWNDLVLFAASHRAAEEPARLREVVELARALAGSAERRFETDALGGAFAAAVGPWTEIAEASRPYPVAVALAAARTAVPPEAALAAFANAFAASLVSAAVRLVPLGQSQAMRILAALEPVILRAAAAAARSTLDDLGQAAFLSEIAAMRHETLQPRLFRS